MVADRQSSQHWANTATNLGDCLRNNWKPQDSVNIRLSANGTFFFLLKTYISVFCISLSFCLSPLESTCLTPVDSASSAYHLILPYWLPGNRLLDIRQWHHTHCCSLIGSHPKKPGSLSRGCRPPELTALGKHGNQLGGLLEE